MSLTPAIGKECLEEFRQKKQDKIKSYIGIFTTALFLSAVTYLVLWISTGHGEFRYMTFLGLVMTIEGIATYLACKHWKYAAVIGCTIVYLSLLGSHVILTARMNSSETTDRVRVIYSLQPCFVIPYAIFTLLLSPSFLYSALVYTPAYITGSSLNDIYAFNDLVLNGVENNEILNNGEIFFTKIMYSILFLGVCFMQERIEV